MGSTTWLPAYLLSVHTILYFKPTLHFLPHHHHLYYTDHHYYTMQTSTCLHTHTYTSAFPLPLISFYYPLHYTVFLGPTTYVWDLQPSCFLPVATPYTHATQHHLPIYHHLNRTSTLFACLPSIPAIFDYLPPSTTTCHTPHIHTIIPTYNIQFLLLLHMHYTCCVHYCI